MNRSLDRPLNICLLSYRSNPHCGGQGVYLKNLSRALTDIGHHVDVVSGPPDPMLDADIPIHRRPAWTFTIRRPVPGPHPERVVGSGQYHGVGGGFHHGFSRAFYLRHPRPAFLRTRMQHYDIVHDNQSLSYGIWSIAKKIPTVATIHHPITVDRDIAVRSVRPFWKKLKHLRWFSFIGMQKRVSRTLRRDHHRFRMRPRGHCPGFQDPAGTFFRGAQRHQHRLFYPIPDIRREPGRIIVTNSSDVPLKGLYYLLHAVAEIAKKRLIRLVVVGTPKKNGGITRLIRRLGIGDLITYTGRISDEEFVRQYARAAMAVVSSVYEGFGLPAGEAMACGVPVISTTGGALPEVVGDAGILVPPKDHMALARAIVDMLDHPDQANGTGSSGIPAGAAALYLAAGGGKDRGGLSGRPSMITVDFSRLPVSPRRSHPGYRLRLRPPHLCGLSVEGRAGDRCRPEPERSEGSAWPLEFS
jgi:glycosyltransferase involved in cell wall biosynthesis